MFTFKQFKIHQEHTAMKVCTDSCLFGGLINADNHTRALDIGTGTGLLSLMLAQKNTKLQIDAIEIDNNAAIDAQKNFSKSVFSNQIKLEVSSIQDFTKNNSEKYDLIFTNPPFYENSLLSPSNTKNIAHHTTLLGLEDLASVIQNLLLPTGKAWIMLPPISFNKFRETALDYGLFCTEITDIHHDTEKPCLRKVGVFEKTQKETILNSPVFIRDKNEYSAQYKEILKDYYLIF